MITNFEEITKELNAEERQLVPVLIKGFKAHGKENPIKAPKIVENLRIVGYKITEPRLRKLVNLIRSKGLLPVIATSNGYYWNIPYEMNASASAKDYYPLAHLVDFDPPAISDNTLGPAYTGDPFIIQVNITDISNVSQVQVFYYFGSDIASAKNRTMVYNSGNDLWEHAVEGDIPSTSLDPLKYNISAVDPNDHWGESTELSITSAPTTITLA